ncbi:MAG: asparagine synthase (glutamine-hydrolyzing) [Elusimicrobia bacterium]|nr:MAG: asparagine synthase (glutamine-hydrolyzing) [Elusimicrobiota bacterium]
MCGIVGEFRLDGGAADAGRVEAAREKLAHRGPDDAGGWSEGAVAFGFRRLSILDLERGAQPMRTEDGRFTVVFNGEIYNHPQLKEELEAAGVTYRTHSDAETVLHLFAREGEGALHRLEGMFAIAVYDAKKKELLLARDPLGVKPLYYSFEGSRITFASELKSMLSLVDSKELDPSGVMDYLSYGYVHAPRTLFDNILKLSPGHFLRINAHGLKQETFWEIPTRPPWGVDGSAPSIKEALDQVERLLIGSVRSQLMSDVPVGSFLSGGVDSSLITAIMARASKEKVKTFSIGFSGAKAGIDESSYARTVARYLGTDHQELILPADILSNVEGLGDVLDEPIADSAILPTFLLSKFTRKQVKVVLTGEGADELFGGYNRYKAAYLSEAVDRAPRWSRGLAAAAARRMGKGKIFRELPHANRGSWARAVAHHHDASHDGLLTREFHDRTGHLDAMDWLKDPEAPHTLNGALAFDLKTVLSDCLLMKVDKTTMRAGLEARVPFLDRRLVEYALHLPASTKIRRLKGKYILRKLADKYLPRPIVWRKKHGFVVPWEEWARNPDNTVLGDLFSGGAWTTHGLFEPKHLAAMLAGVRGNDPTVDSGLFFRIAVLLLWFESL